ncbi:MAG: hypothetical protein HKN92_12135 [Chitinophagales bacterium]|nr:hypothetical protein [Chitinophagales bacterium]
MFKSIIGIAVIALLFSACQDAGQSDEMKQKDMEKVLKALETKMEALQDSLNIACDNMIDSMARVKIAASVSKSAGTAGSSSKTSTATKTNKTSTSTQTKKGKMSGEPIEVTKEQTEKKEDKMGGGKIDATKEDTKKKKSKMGGGGL